MIEKPVNRTLGAIIGRLRAILANYVLALPTYPALLGDGHGTVEVAGWPGWVWVRVGSDERLERAFNQRVPLRDGLAIIVGYDWLQPKMFQVLSQRDDAYAGAGTGQPVIPQVVGHHESHQFPTIDDDDSDGSDVTYIHWRQMRGLRVYIVSGFTVGIERWPIRRGSTNIWIATQQINLTADRPVSGARYVTMYLDTDGVFQRRLGSIVAAASITIADAPLTVAGEWELANVLLWSTQVELKDDGERQDIVDRRFPATYAASGTIASDVEIEEIGTATYDDLQDWLNLTQSAGYMAGGLITAHAADAITGVNGAGGGAGAGEFEVAGDQTAGFGAGVVITVSGSTGNDGNYTISAGGATHDAGTTTIPVDEAVPDATVDGDIDALGTLDISAVKGFIKTTDSEIGVTQSFDLAAITNFVLIDASTNYVFVDYNAGTPAFDVTTTRSDVEMNRQFTLGRVYRDGLTLHIIQSGIQLPNFLRGQHEYAIAIHGFARASGGEIAESGNRFLASDAGVFYLGRNEATTTGKDTDNGDTFTRHYHAAGPVWTSDVQSQICAAAYQYDDGTGLQNFTKYGVFWVFIHSDSDLHVVVGRDDYTLAEAQAATVPSTPNSVSDFATLAAKIIVKFNGVNFHALQSAYEVVFPLGGGLDHNDLGSIQGGQADQYYHTTEAQHTAVGLMVTAGVQALTAGEVTQLGNIGVATISGVTWGYVGALDQPVGQASSPTFAGLEINAGDIDPRNASGQNLGDATHRWDVFASYVDLSNGGWVGIGGNNEMLTVNAAGTFAFTGIAGVTVEDDDWIGLGAAAGRLAFDGTPARDILCIYDGDLYLDGTGDAQDVNLRIYADQNNAPLVIFRQGIGPDAANPDMVMGLVNADPQTWYVGSWDGAVSRFFLKVTSPSGAVIIDDYDLSTTVPSLEIQIPFTDASQDNSTIFFSGVQNIDQRATIAFGNNPATDTNALIAFDSVVGWRSNIHLFVNDAGAGQTLAQVLAAGVGMTIGNTGNVKITSLAGVGVRAVVAAADGTLSAP